MMDLMTDPRLLEQTQSPNMSFISQLMNAPAVAESAPSANAFSLPASDARYVEQDAKHKGVAGAARDVLGFLGDFLLTRLHMKPMYEPAQEKRKYAIASRGFGTDPQSTADAISRVRDLGYVDQANKLTDQMLDNRRSEASLASTQEDRAARLEVSRAAARKDALARGASSLHAAISRESEEKRPEAYKNMRSLLDQNFANSGDPELSRQFRASFGEDYNPDIVIPSLMQHVTISKQLDQEFRRKNAADINSDRDDAREFNQRMAQVRLELQKRGLALREEAAARGGSRGGGRPRSPKLFEEVIRLIDKPTRTKGEQAVVDRYIDTGPRIPVNSQPFTTSPWKR